MTWGALGERPDVVYQDDAVILLNARWQDVVGDLPVVDAVITDPPYSARTHKGQTGRRKEAAYTTGGRSTLASRGLNYGHWTPADVNAFVQAAEPVCRGWFCAMTSHDLVAPYTDALHGQGRYVFAPLACMQMYRNVRLVGDGPAQWADRLVVARTSSLSKWGALPGGYVGQSFDAGQNALDRSKGIPGGKPLWLMRAIVGDYSRPGDLILDPCAGGGTTGVAARLEGRRCILIEMDPDTAALAARRLDRNRDFKAPPEQGALFQ